MGKPDDNLRSPLARPRTGLRKRELRAFHGELNYTVEPGPQSRRDRRTIGGAIGQVMGATAVRRMTEAGPCLPWIEDLSRADSVI